MVCEVFESCSSYHGLFVTLQPRCTFGAWLSTVEWDPGVSSGNMSEEVGLADYPLVCRVQSFCSTDRTLRMHTSASSSTLMSSVIHQCLLQCSLVLDTHIHASPTLPVGRHEHADLHHFPSQDLLPMFQAFQTTSGSHSMNQISSLVIARFFVEVPGQFYHITISTVFIDAAQTTKG
jgi:hypothetical protein